MRITTSITTNLPGLRGYSREVSSVIMPVVIKKWIIRYRAFVQKRFNTYSRGGGDWPALKIRKGSILRDTNTLFTVMAPTLQAPAGSINEPLSDGLGVEIGYSGGASHPGGATIAEIVYWHHYGLGNNPVRQIIVLPDERTKDAMAQDMQKATDEYNRKLNAI